MVPVAQNSVAQAWAHGPPAAHAHAWAALTNAMPPMGCAFTQQSRSHCCLPGAPPSSAPQQAHSTGPMPELAPLAVAHPELELLPPDPPLLLLPLALLLWTVPEPDPPPLVELAGPPS